MWAKTLDRALAKARFPSEDEKAEADLARAAQGDDSFDLLYYLGASRFKLEAYNEAIAGLKKALDKKPGDRDALKFLVEAYFRRAESVRDPGEKSRAYRDAQRTVKELAEPFTISMPAISNHLKVLERAGLIERGREAQWRRPWILQR